MEPVKRKYENDFINPMVTVPTTAAAPMTRKRYAASAYRVILNNVKSFRSTLTPIFENCFRCQDNGDLDEDDSRIEDKYSNDRDEYNDFAGDEAAGFEWSY